MPANRLALQDIKQRLLELGMIEAPNSNSLNHVVAGRGLPEMASTNNFNPVLSISPGNIAPSLPLSLESPETVRAKILHALNSPERADAVVPHSGQPDGLKAIFIKSNGDGAKLTIVDNSSTISDTIGIQKTSSLGGGAPEAMGMTMGLDPITNNYPLMTQSVKSPQGVRKFHSWLSYFYSGGGKTSGTSSPKSNSLPISPHIVEPNISEEDQLDRLVTKIPSKGILKPAKNAFELLSSHPPPIDKSMFLKQEEIQRLTYYANIRLRADSVIEEGDGVRRKSAFGRRRRIKFDFDRTQYYLTHSRTDYERGGVEYIAKFLTPEIALMIKRELNEVKKEMSVHEESRHHTQFYHLR